MQKRISVKISAVILAVVMVLGMTPGVMLISKASPPGTYNTGDIAVINALVANNGLGSALAPADGSSVPSGWNNTIIWSNSVSDKRVKEIWSNHNYVGLTGTLDVSGLSNLEQLSCYSNNLTGLNASGLTNLTNLICHSNYLTRLDVSGCANLTTLNCRNNNLTELDVSGCTRLSLLNVSNNCFESPDSITGLETVTAFNGWIEDFYFSPQKTIVPGKLTPGDGPVSIADALVALRIAARLLIPEPWQLLAGCVTGGTSIAIADVLLILRVAAKLTSF